MATFDVASEPRSPSRTPARVRGRLGFLVMAAALTSAVGSCSEDKAGKVMVLRIKNAPGLPVPGYIVLSWESPGGIGARNLRLPKEGALVPESGETLASMSITITDEIFANRTVLAVGRQAGDDAVVSAFKGSVPAPFDAPRLFSVVLVRSDADQDGLLDPLDPCPVVVGPCDPDLDAGASQQDAATADAALPLDDGATDGGAPADVRTGDSPAEADGSTNRDGPG